MTDARRFQLYGRRKGHSLRRHHLQLMQDLLPKVRTDLAAPLGTAHASDCWLEIGFGGGEHLAHQAALHPDIQFIGAEPFINGVAKLLAFIDERNLRNVSVHDGDARYLLEALPDQSIGRIFLLYPDPWPKARHNRRRIVGAETLAQMHRVLKPRGLLLFASDIADYVQWTREHVAEHGGFVEEGDPDQPFTDWIETRYEAKAKREGRKPQYLRLRRVDPLGRPAAA